MRNKLVLIFVAPFIGVLAVAFFVSYRFVALYSLVDISGGEGGDMAWIELVIALLVLTGLILLARKILKHRAGIVYRLLFYAALYGSFTVFFSVFFMNSLVVLALSVLLLIGYIKIKSVVMHNATVLVSFGSVAALVGLTFYPQQIVSILAVLSLYDYIAVYITGHMQKMAVDMVGEGVIPAVVLSRGMPEKIDRTEIVPKKGNIIMLGGGDLILPTALVASVVPINVTAALLIGVFIIAGAAITAIIFQSGEREPIPALPPLAFSAVLGYLIVVLTSLV